MPTFVCTPWPLSRSTRGAKSLMASLLHYERPWYAPGLWRVEVLSGLRKIVAANLMIRAEMCEAVSRF